LGKREKLIGLEQPWKLKPKAIDFIS